MIELRTATSATTQARDVVGPLPRMFARNIRTRVSPKEVRDLQDMTSTYSRRYTTVGPVDTVVRNC
ncbi:hypothetical protein BPOR_0909g00030 [Botrytis porri]|uniref:Uncharacterized protein n=1 Tax=Botrytis porri TaxID=87229 RepID=A0A4Z1K840_9HELO|nr:hypothetical protein BPOR_0909g00030 [Botrytis porri]